MTIKINMRDLDLQWSRPEAEPNAIQVDAYIGGLHVGQRTYYATSMKVALGRAIRYIELHGSLHEPPLITNREG